MNTSIHKLLLTAVTSALLTFGLATPSALQAQTKAEQVQRVQLLLNAYDRAPDAAQFKRAATDPRSILLDIESNPSSPEYLRLRALDALSLFPDEQVRARFRTILKDATGQNPAPRAVHNSINGLMLGWGAESNEELLALLAHPDIQVRLTVAVAVGRSGGISGRNALRSHLGREKDPLVREFIETHAPLQK